MARKVHPATQSPRREGPGEEPEPQHVSDETDVQDMEEAFGAPSGLTCPECGGALWEIRNGALTRYRCHVGHQYSSDGLDAEQHGIVEGALWSAVRLLEERADLRERMARRAEADGLQSMSDAFTKSAGDSHQQAHTIRGLLFGRAEPSPMPLVPSTTLRANPSTSLRAGNGRGKARRRKR